MTNCKHDWHFIEGLRDLLADVTTMGSAWSRGGERIDPRDVYAVSTGQMQGYKLHDSRPNSIQFYNTNDEPRTEVLRISKDGIWANPDVPCDDAAKAVLAAVDGYVKGMVEKAVIAAQAWIPVTERLPKPGKFVLAVFRYSTGKQVVIRAMHAPPKTLSEEDYGEFLTDPDYDEATDTTYWPEGWYECNDNEETHWQVHEEVTHWMPLPGVPHG
jgi:hypothetical protein